jgi:hypothetical protein
MRGSFQMVFAVLVVCGLLHRSGARASEPMSPWGPGIRSLELRVTSPARHRPSATSQRFGLIAKGTRVVWTALGEAGGRGCPRWIAVAPRGWLCEDEVTPSVEPPTIEDLPQLRPGQIVPSRFDPREVADPAGVLTSDHVDAAHQRRCEVAPTWHAAKTREREDVSDFAGVRLDCPGAPALPFGWVQRTRGLKQPVIVRAAPKASASVVRRLEPRALVPLSEPLERRGGFVKIGADGWVLASDLHVARAAARPAGVADSERWFDVDLAEQVLVAMEGDRPAYATLIAGGLKESPTPTGIWRVLIKRTVALMYGADYRVHVPWTMYLDDYYAIHSAYWHDRYGLPTSHGCVNLPPIDARVLFHWAGPAVPAGWASVRGDVETPGTLVRIRRGLRLNVPVRGYARELMAR